MAIALHRATPLGLIPLDPENAPPAVVHIAHGRHRRYRKPLVNRGRRFFSSNLGRVGGRRRLCAHAIGNGFDWGRKCFCDFVKANNPRFLGHCLGQGGGHFRRDGPDHNSVRVTEVGAELGRRLRLEGGLQLAHIIVKKSFKLLLDVKDIVLVGLMRIVGVPLWVSWRVRLLVDVVADAIKLGSSGARARQRFQDRKRPFCADAASRWALTSSPPAPMPTGLASASGPRLGAGLLAERISRQKPGIWGNFPLLPSPVRQLFTQKGCPHRWAAQGA